MKTEQVLDLENYPFLKKYEEAKPSAGLKRVQEIKDLATTFQTNMMLDFTIGGLTSNSKVIVETGRFRDDAEFIIADKYFQNFEFFMRYIESEDGKETNANIYKIISGLELAICEVQPFYHPDFDIRKRINAHFGFFVGLGFLTGWEQTDFLKFSFPNLSESEGTELSKLIQEHIDWLYMLQSQFHLPYFSNAHTWWALKLLLQELNEERR